MKIKAEDIHVIPIQNALQAEKEIRRLRLNGVSHAQKLDLQTKFETRDKIIAEIDKKVADLMLGGCLNCGGKVQYLDGFSRGLCDDCFDVELSREDITHRSSDGDKRKAQIDNWIDQSERVGYEFLAQSGAGTDEFLRWYVRNYHKRKEDYEIPSESIYVSTMIQHGLASGW